MSSPRSLSLLAWMPPQGSTGQRVARAALVRAFADVAALPTNRTGRVRAVLAEIASRAEAAYADALASRDEDAPAPRKATRKASARKASARKAPASGGGARLTQGYCKPCRLPFRDDKAHRATARHKAAVKAAVAADNA